MKCRAVGVGVPVAVSVKVRVIVEDGEGDELGGMDVVDGIMI